MPLPRSIALAIVAGLVTAVAPVAALAAPSSPPAPRPAHPVTSGTANAAERALEAVQAAFQRDDMQRPRPAAVGVRGGELTQQMVQLRLGLDELSGADRELAEAFLARPTDGTEWRGANYGPRARPTSDCEQNPAATRGSEVCIHYARRNRHAPPRGDANSNGVPDQVERTGDILNHSWDRIVTGGEYRAPLGDGTRGGDSRLDVYLVDLGWDGLYGYCTPEYPRAGRAAPSYCVLDDDYTKDQFPNGTPLGNLQVTAAHEFFHAVQFAYDAFEDAWLMETTATWVEDEVYDNVNDNRYFLAASALRAPGRALDAPTGSFVYGNWIWWRYLTETYPDTGSTGLPLLVRRVWELADGAKGTYSMAALDRALAEQELELAEVFADFSVANRMPAATYEEGGAYRSAPLAAKHRLSQERRGIDAKRRQLAHLSSATVAFRPDGSLDASDWRLRIRVDLPRRKQQPSAVVTVIGRDGSVERHSIRLNRKGNGALPVPFDANSVRRVELTLVNGNHAYNCNEGTQWSCRGIPSPRRPFTYRAWAFRAAG